MWLLHTTPELLQNVSHILIFVRMGQLSVIPTESFSIHRTVESDIFQKECAHFWIINV